MYPKNTKWLLKAMGATLMFATSATATHAAVNYYECADKGFISATYQSKAGVIATSNKGSDINLLRNGQLTPLVESPGAGMYINVSADGRYVGFKSINKDADQAPALLDVESGKVTLLEDYVDQCGQVSFANDGTMAYTMGNTLVIRSGDSRRSYDLGQYVNIANISPDGTKVAYTNIEGMMHVLDLSTGRTETIDGNGAYRAIWSPDNGKLAVQQVNGGLFSMEIASKKIHTLGEASSVSWSNNADELLITRSHRVNELEVMGAEVVSMRYDGSGETTLVPLTESTPVSVSATGNDIVVSYATGLDRGVKSIKYSMGIRRNAPASVTTLGAFRDQRIGSTVASDFKGFKRIDYSKFTEAELEKMVAKEAATRQKATSLKKANNIGLTDIPYINQVWDTPAVNGSYKYGYVCCAPSSSCMMLGWLGYVSPHAVTSRSSYAAVKTCNYSWYVAKQYTSKTGYVFSKTASGNGTSGVAGGYGYMWGYGSPSSMMAKFHTNNGVAKSYFSSSWNVLVTQCNANRPYIICLQNGTGGHVVIVFRANQQAANDGSSTWSKTGSFICHDPYGDYNGSSYPNWDGRYATYDWPGYSNGKKNIGVFYWGCVSEFTSTGTATSDPTITVSPTDVKFTCQVNETPSVTVTVTGKDLSDSITIASSHGWRFPVSTTKLPKTGGKFTVKMAHSESAGTYGQGGTALDGTFYVRVKSGSTEKTINITADVTAPPLEGLTEKWVYSQKRGNASSQDYDMSKIRNFAYNNGKLYCVYDNSKILVLNAQTGASLGFLSNGDVVKGGAVALADVKVINNVVVASNIAVAANSQDLRLYAWESDNAEPQLIYSTTDFQGAARLGDCLELYGTYATDCWFTFANDANSETRIVEYNRKDGTWLGKYTKVLTSAGKQYACGATVRAYHQSGGWWIDGKNSQAAWTTWDDTQQGAVVQTKCATDYDRGSSHHEFLWKGLKYAANLIFEDNSGNNARMRIIQDKTGNFSSTSQIGTYPSDGLGAVPNTAGTGDCMINTDGQTYLEAWVLSTNQGIGYFTVGTPPTTNPDPITPPATTPSLKANPSALNFNCKIDATESKQIAITGSNLKGDISLSLSGTDASLFSLSTDKITQAAANGSVTVTYSPESAGNHSATLTISTPEANDVTVAINGTATSKVTFSDDITADKFNGIWVSSVTAGLKSWHTDVTTHHRSIAYNNGKLYVLNCKSWAAPSIAVINAYTGEFIKNLDVTGVTGATFQIGDLAVLDGKLIACNVSTAAQNFRVYKWEDDNSAPTVILARDGNGVNGKAGGAAMSVTGNWNSGKLIFATDGSNSIVYFEVKNGAVDTTPHEITLTDKDGKAYTNATEGRGTARVIVNSDGTMWITTRFMAPSLFSAEGKLMETINTSALGGNIYGTAFNIFPFGSKTYAAATTYKGGSQTFDGGQMSLINFTDGISAATAPIATVPESGLGTQAANWQSINTICQSTRDEGTTLDLWFSIGQQGVAHYSYVGRTSTGVEEVALEADNMEISIAGGVINVSGDVARIEVYTMAGMMVTATPDCALNTNDLPVGIYIIRAVDNTGHSIARKVVVAR